MTSNTGDDRPHHGALSRRHALGGALAIAGVSAASDAFGHQSNRSAASGAEGQAGLPGSASYAYVPDPQAQALPGVQRTLAEKLHDFPLSPEDFGAAGDGVRDDTAAFDAAIAEAIRRNNATIQLSGGKTYRIDGSIRIAQGIAIRGPGSQGSTPRFGCTIRHHGAGDLFIWDGSGKPYAGTGGGLRDVLIIKAPGQRGGCAIRIAATDDSHRPGEMFFENVLIYGGQEGDRSGLWDHSVVIDGTRCNQPGARGVRSTRWSGCRFASTASEGQTVVLRQVTHAYFIACAIDTGGGAPAGVYLEGHNDNVHFSAAGLAGSLTIAEGSAENSLLNFTFTGKIGGAFINKDANATGAVMAVFDNAGHYVLVNHAKALVTKTNIDPNFKVTRASDSTLRFSGAEEKVVAWERELFDMGSTVLPPFDRFICAAAGLYEFHATLNLRRLSSGDGAIAIALVHQAKEGGKAVVRRSFWFSGLTPETMVSVDIAGTFELAFGDKVAVAVSGSGTQPTVLRVLGSDGGVSNSWFDGRRL